MALLTGQPAAATVRASSELDLLVLTEQEFADLGERFPQVYRNLGTLLAERLAHTNRLVAKRAPGRLVLLSASGAPPLLGCALACSVAWHTRERTLFLAVRSDPAPELRSLAKAARDRTGDDARRGVAILHVEAPHGRYTADAFYETLIGLFDRFQNIVVEVDAGSEPALQTARRVRLESGDVRGASPDGVLCVRGWASGTTTLRPHHDHVVMVPELDDGDLRSVRDGVLPSSTAAGHALGWAARDLTGLKVGLALGAGSTRGYAHVGVIESLQRTGVPVDCIAGTSIGSAVAGLYALGQDPGQIADTLDEFGPNLFKLHIPVRSLLSNRGMRRYMLSVAGDARIEDLDVPIALVAADIVKQREVVFRRGLLWQAVLTSVSIPGIYPASPIGGAVLVDGGVLNPVPVNVAASIGAGVVIAVRLGDRMVDADYELEARPAMGTPPTATVGPPALDRDHAVANRGRCVRSDGRDVDADGRPLRAEAARLSLGEAVRRRRSRGRRGGDAPHRRRPALALAATRPSPHSGATRVAAAAAAGCRACVRLHGANGFATPSSEGASSGKCRSSTDFIELFSTQSSPAWVYTFGV